MSTLFADLQASPGDLGSGPRCEPFGALQAIGSLGGGRPAFLVFDGRWLAPRSVN